MSQNGMRETAMHVLGGVSPLASGMLALLVQNPSFSISPYFSVVLFGGFITLAISVGRFMERKHGWEGATWHVAGVAVEGYVLVSWAKYQSVPTALATAMMFSLVCIAVTLLRRNKIATWYPKYKGLIYVAMLIAIAFPYIVPVQSFEQRPVLAVSASNSYVSLHENDNSPYMNVSVASVYGDVWDIRLQSAGSSSLISSYINNRLNGPVEIPYLRRGTQEFLLMRIETSPRILNGVYNVTINYSYKDAESNTYTGSTPVEVDVCRTDTICPIAAESPGLIAVPIIGALIVLALALLLSRFRKPHKTISKETE